MKLVTPALAGHLAQETTSLCRLLKIMRPDGTVLRTTDHDNTIGYTETATAPIGIVGLMGAFTDASGNVLVPLAIGAGQTLIAPYGVGAVTLQLGVNDDILSENGGSWNVTVTAPSGTWTGTVDGHAGPWEFSSGKNAAYTFGGNPSNTPQVVPLTINPGDTVTVKWNSGSVSYRIIPTVTITEPTGTVSPNGFVTGTSNGASGHPFPSKYAQNMTVVTPVTYVPADGLTFSALEHKDDGSPNNTQVTGFLRGSGIDEADIRARLYDGATFELRTVNWSDLTQGDMKLLSGTVGDVTMVNGQFQIELRGLNQWLTTMVGAVYGPICRAELFGGGAEGIDPANHWKCRLNRADWVQTGTLLSVSDSLTLVPSPSSALLMIGSATPAVAAPAGWFDSGVIKFTSGALSGFSFEVSTWDGTTLVLFGGAPMPFPPAAGDSFQIEPGCSKLMSICHSKFNNAVNFAGEPNIPGINVLSTAGRPQVQTR